MISSQRLVTAGDVVGAAGRLLSLAFLLSRLFLFRSAEVIAAVLMDGRPRFAGSRPVNPGNNRWAGFFRRLINMITFPSALPQKLLDFCEPRGVQQPTCSPLNLGTKGSCYFGHAILNYWGELF